MEKLEVQSEARGARAGEVLRGWILGVCFGAVASPSAGPGKISKTERLNQQCILLKLSGQQKHLENANLHRGESCPTCIFTLLSCLVTALDADALCVVFCVESAANSK